MSQAGGQGADVAFESVSDKLRNKLLHEAGVPSRDLTLTQLREQLQEAEAAKAGAQKEIERLARRNV